MKPLIAALMVVLGPGVAVAGGSVFVVAGGYHAPVPPVRIQMRADYVGVPITVSTDSKDAVKGAGRSNGRFARSPTRSSNTPSCRSDLA